MPARFRIRSLLDRQGDALARLTDRDVRLFLRAFEDSRRELQEQLRSRQVSGADKATPYTTQHLRVMLAQVERGMMDLQRRLGQVMDEATRRQWERSLEDLVTLIGRQEREFGQTGPRIETQAMQRMVQSDGLLLHQHSIERYGRDLISKIQSELVRGVVQSMTIDQVTDRIVAADASVFAGMRHRAELIARMEFSRAYNDMHQAGLEEASQILDADEPDRPDPLVKKADEFLDKRNHPFSRALDGKVAPITTEVNGQKVPGEWEVPNSEVEAAAKAIGKRPTGIVWRKEGSTWKGSVHPAHYNDRGRMVPWRASWGDGTRTGGAKVPHASRRILPQGNPTPDPRIVIQEHDAACGPAAGETLARLLGAENVDHGGLMAGILPTELGGIGVKGSDLADRLNRFAPLQGKKWVGGELRLSDREKGEILDVLLRQGPLVALVEPKLNRDGHWLVVTSRSGDLLEILDPEGLRYSTPVVKFLEKWPMVAVFSR